MKKNKKMPNMFGAIEIEINSGCNMVPSCSYCPNVNSKHLENLEMDLELFSLLIKQLSDYRYRGRVSFHFYGEPLISSNLEIFVQITKRDLPDCKIKLYTNGILLTEKKVKDLISLGVDEFLVTKHKVSSCYEFDKTLAMLESKFKDNIRCMDYSGLVLTSRGGILKNKEVKTPLKKICLIPTFLTIVTLAGDVLPCYEDYYRQNKMGNIKRNHIVDIWLSERYQKMRLDLRNRQRDAYAVCRDCDNLLVIP